MRIVLFLLLALGTVSGRTQSADFERLFSQFRNMAAFDHAYPREKVYLHLDNNGYFEGENLWFKAYVMRASSLQTTPLSGVLYVELLDDNGFEIDRQLLRIDSLGQADGAFKLVPPVKAGFYEVRAYTREMLNWGTDVCFSRVVPVFEKIPESKSPAATALEVPRPTGPEDLRTGHLRPYTFGGERHVVLNFFPEGGHRVAGVPQNIAYCLTDGAGQPLDAPLTLCDGAGAALLTSRPEHAGMGALALPAVLPDGAYVTVRHGEKDFRFKLPEADPSVHYALSAQPHTEGVELTVHGRADRPQLLGLAVSCRDRVCYFDTLTVGRETVALQLGNATLHDGVNRIDLFTADGRCLATRLVWKNTGARQLAAEVAQSAAGYEAFSPVALTLRLSDDAGLPVATTVSLAVRDAAADLVAPAPAAELAASLLLSSEVRGYIHRPEYYFEANDGSHRRALDLLLQVQGWQVNDFATFSGQSGFRLTQPIEEKLTLNGRVTHDNDRDEPYPDLDLSIRMYTLAGASLSGETRTDSLGAFAFASNVDYIGDWIAQISTKNDQGKYKRSRVMLNRFFEVAPRPYGAGELALLPPPAPEAMPEYGPEPVLFEWTDTIPHMLSTVLAEAQVTGKGRYGGFTGNRYSYKGGEEAGKRRVDYYFNIEREVERLKDRGRAVGTIWTLLGELSDKFHFTRGTEEAGNVREALRTSGEAGVTYSPEARATDGLSATPSDYIDLQWGSNKMLIFIDNMLCTGPVEDLWADEVKSVVIMRNRESWLQFVPAAQVARLSSGNVQYAIFVYTRPDYHLYRSRRGRDMRVITGYAPPVRFYSPDYRRVDVPAAADHRRTLYWNPSVSTDAAGRASVVFFGNARPAGRLRISLRGVTTDGRYVSCER